MSFEMFKSWQSFNFAGPKKDKGEKAGQSRQSVLQSSAQDVRSWNQSTQSRLFVETSCYLMSAADQIQVMLV